MHAPGLHDQVGLSVHFRDLFVFDKTKGLKKIRHKISRVYSKNSMVLSSYTARAQFL